MKGIVAGLSLPLLLGGCASTLSQQQKDFHNQALVAPRCTSQRQCEAAWAAALDWANRNCDMEIQGMGDSRVETYHWFDTSLACHVAKDPDTGGGYSFSITVSCRNVLGCEPNIYEATRAFDAEVRDVSAQFAGE